MAFIGSGRFLATAISALAAVAILSLAAWMLLGNDGQPGQDDAAVQVIPPAAASSPNETAGAEPTGAEPNNADAGSQPAAPAEIAVYLTGEVVKPGVYVTTPDQRLDTILQLAGGPTEHADLNRVNLAAYVTDAAHYRIPALADSDTDPDAVSAASSAGDAIPEAPAAAPCAVPLDINTASAKCLKTLPGIGDVKAQAIVAYREQAGPFATTDGITAVSGIGSGTYDRIADLIIVNAR